MDYMKHVTLWWPGYLQVSHVESVNLYDDQTKKYKGVSLTAEVCCCHRNKNFSSVSAHNEKFSGIYTDRMLNRQDVSYWALHKGSKKLI